MKAVRLAYRTGDIVGGVKEGSLVGSAEGGKVKSNRLQTVSPQLKEGRVA